MNRGSGRVTCPRCGANNFDTVTACWKCSAPLTGAATSPQPDRASPASAGQSFGGVGGAAQAAGFRSISGSNAASERAALWLGLLFPYFGLPVGLVFMMLDDDRKQQLGRICILWSCLSMLVHVAFLAAAALGMRELLFAALQGVRGAASRGSGIEGF